MVLIKSLFRKKGRNEEGQGTVEFALILPILLAIIFGIIDFGWLFFNMELVSNTARSSARHAIVSVHDYAETGADGKPVEDGATHDVVFNKTEFETQLKSRIQKGLPSYLTKSSANLAVTANELNTVSSIKNKVIEVTVEVDIPLFTPVLWTITGSKNYHIRRTVKLKREY
ncbi:TadE/TadG family type IV pilus assembly protein [Eubacterium sp.]|uniref:TadE/TadG family type IV pilus assembly protein n=1 Tax=Eubacterium sp. TaxID=142586 RepID=UPI0025EB8B9B|nr:TadE/TadG family type IV pilus assembly protein [Eubacterium sp.]MCR5629260.1 pilus assembly protein [Eubacterium sp.]